MPRELSNNLCEITFNDRISGDKLTLYHYMPTSEDRIKYANGFITRQGNKIVSTLGELRIKAGCKIFAGFKTGAFSIPGKGLISSKPGDPNYDPAWKAAVKQYAPDVIEMLSIHVFESSLLRVASSGAEALDVLPASDEDWGEEPGPTGSESITESGKPEDGSPLS